MSTQTQARVTIEATGGKWAKDSEGQEMIHWQCTLGYRGRSMAVPEFRCGAAWTEGRRWSVWPRKGEIPESPKLGHAGGHAEGQWWVRAKAPAAFDVLYCICADSSGYDNARSFEDWCGDYGYDTDSRKAEGIYRACADQAKALRHFLGAEYEAVVGMDEDALQAWASGEAVAR